ncbi:MAG: tyrosine-type recombinase/integrase [Alcanivorax sp.]
MNPITVTEVLTRYRVGHVQRNTAAPRRACIAIDHLDGHLGVRHACSLRDRDFHLYAEKRGVSDSTVRRELGVLRAALRYCVRQKLIAVDDVPHIDLPPEAPPADKWLTEAQVRVLLDTMDQLNGGARMTRAHRFVILALATGSRRRAIERLTWDLVNLDDAVVRYDRLPMPQTKKRRVASPIPEWAVPYLRRMLRERDGDYVLDHPGSIRTAFETLMKAVSRISKDPVYATINRHALRHTYGTLSLRAGVPLWQVAGLLGDSVETTAAVYGHHAQDNLRQAANSMRF